MSDNQTPEGYRPGLTARERAALELRLPDSGTPWLDEMIAKARLLDTATAMETAYISVLGNKKDEEPVEFLGTLAEVSLQMAERLLDEALTEPRIEVGPVDLTAHPIGKPASGAGQTMRVDGVDYRRLPESSRGPMESRSACGGCACLRSAGGCELAASRRRAIERDAFGNDCSDARVIYVRTDK